MRRRGRYSFSSCSALGGVRGGGGQGGSLFLYPSIARFYGEIFMLFCYPLITSNVMEPLYVVTFVGF